MLICQESRFDSSPSIIIPIGMIKGEALNSIKSLKQTGRANATVEHFFFTGIFPGSMVFWSSPSGSLALRYVPSSVTCSIGVK